MLRESWSWDVSYTHLDVYKRQVSNQSEYYKLITASYQKSIASSVASSIKSFLSSMGMGNVATGTQSVGDMSGGSAVAVTDIALDQTKATIKAGETLSLTCLLYTSNLARCREKFAGKLVLKAGMELGQGQLDREWEKTIIDLFPFDFIIGSVHKMDNVDMGKMAFADEAQTKRIIPVSYTHLDVYKRQAREYGNIEIGSLAQLEQRLTGGGDLQP